MNHLKIILLTFVTLLFGFNNCSDVDFSSAPEESSSSANDDSLVSDYEIDKRIEEVKNNCEKAKQNQSLKTKSINVFFPEPNKTCEWNQNGNLGPLNQFLQARIEQTQSFSLNDGAQICNIDFQFDNQDFHYDDLFLLTFNDSVLASGYDLTGIMPTRADGIFQYNWQHIVGKDWDHSREEVYCFGEQQGLTNCSFPGHDTPGVISLDIAPELIQSIMGVNFNKREHFFKIVTIGDNDDYDCEHDPLNFSVTVEYTE